MKILNFILLYLGHRADKLDYDEKGFDDPKYVISGERRGLLMVRDTCNILIKIYI